MANLICTLCGYAGETKQKNKGNGFIELILWFFFLIPGIIYSIWRRSDKGNICPKCGNKAMIPLDTPMGQKLMAEQRSNPDMQMQVEQKKPKGTSKTTLYAMFVVLGIVFIFLMIAFSTYKKDAEKAEKEIKAQQTIPVVQNNSLKAKTK